MFNILASLASEEFLEKTGAVQQLLKSHTQLPALSEIKQEGAPFVLGVQLLINNLARVSIPGYPLLASDEIKEISFNSFSSTRPATVKFEDFRPDSEGESRWHTIKLVSRLNERLLFFSLLKKFLLVGLNINEVLTLEYLIELRWSKMSSSEQVSCTLISAVTLASVNRARNFTSVGLNLVKLARRLSRDPQKIVEVRVSRLVILLFSTLLDLEKYERSVKLTFDSFVTPKKTFPAKKHIGVSNSQDGSKSGREEQLDIEIMLESLLPANEDNPASDILEAWLAIKDRLTTM